MAIGAPIITTSIGSNLEVTENGKSAYLVDPANAADLRDAIKYLLENPSKAKKLGEEALCRFLDKYNIDQMA